MSAVCMNDNSTCCFLFFDFSGVRLDRVRGGRQKYRRNTDSHFPCVSYVSKKPSLEGDSHFEIVLFFVVLAR